MASFRFLFKIFALLILMLFSMKRLQVLNLLTKFVLGNPKSLNSAQNDDSSSIRRAISLSDLSMGKGKMLLLS